MIYSKTSQLLYKSKAKGNKNMKQEKELGKWDEIMSRTMILETWDVHLTKYKMKSDYSSVIRVIGEIKVSGHVKSRYDFIWSIGSVNSEKYSNQPSDLFKWVETSVKNLKVKNVMFLIISNMLFGMEIPDSLLEKAEGGDLNA